MTISHTDYLQQVVGAGLGVVPGVWIRLLNNSTSTNYYSTAITTATGAFTHSAPPGDYSLYSGTAATVPGTPTLQSSHYAVPVTAGDDIVGASFTGDATSPYVSSADVGELATATTATRHSGAGGSFSIMALQNIDPAAPDDGTRIYILPRAAIAAPTGIAGALKIFADDYLADSTNYRDNGHYFSYDQLGDYGTQGKGTFVMSSKVNGSYANLNPDLVFSFQDGQYTGARFSFQTDHAVSRGVFVVGDRYVGDVSATTANTAMEVHGEIGFNNTTPGIRWFAAANADVVKTDGTLDNSGPNGLGRITSATAAWTTSDTYKVVTSANLTGAPATRIAYVQSATIAVLTAPVITPSSGQTFTIVSRAPTSAANLIGLNNSDLTLTLNSGRKLRVTSAGSTVLGSGAAQLGTASTDGFLYVWSMAGTPSGVPTTHTGSVPMVVDTTGVKIWFYIGGAWKGVVVA